VSLDYKKTYDSDKVRFIHLSLYVLRNTILSAYFKIYKQMLVLRSV